MPAFMSQPYPGSYWQQPIAYHPLSSIQGSLNPQFVNQEGQLPLQVQQTYPVSYVSSQIIFRTITRS